MGLNRTEAETRAQRLYDAAPHLPILTLVLMIGAAIGVMLLLTSFAVPDMSRRVLLTLGFTLAVLLGGGVLVVVVVMAGHGRDRGGRRPPRRGPGGPSRRRR